MRDRPGVTDADVRAALADGWGITAHQLEYRPIGAGSYHRAVDERWFVTVDRLGFASSFAPLTRALETAAVLRRDAGLAFVVAPIDGPQVLWPVGDGHALAVYPLMPGTSGDFGPHPTASREAVLDLVAALHRATPAVAGVAEVTDLRLPGRAELFDRPWAGGPYAAPAQRLLATHQRKIHAWLDHRDRLAAELKAGAASWVITHGEPHPGNVLHGPTGPLLIDWDTTRIAPPERDLWLLTEHPFDPGPAGLAGPARLADAARLADPAGLDGPAGLARYAEATGHQPSAVAIAFYRLTWILADIAAYTADLRRPHGPGGDAEDALTYLEAQISLI
ncbi:aminoglycoside phosphotransferase family protein [Paractinoplanes toevensis]|uniref:Aminoglycoside phosphotransferase domain-containing protein n=1 Tax=Paractinoplanes toevensis TaxID=571911 RepID=A0A919TGQ3_9ACTN|nr:aminoglycoside phosphotransferase family protein [Actinoplanes toevensis]GIM95017.1 hypothetical protein Ato02nite_068100 [Actinoplanes toevensis]